MKKKSEWDGFWKNKKNFSKKVLDFGRKYYFANMITKQLGDFDGKKVLEAGSGSCESLVYVAKKAKKAIGLDNAPGAIDVGKNNFEKSGISNDKYSLVLGDIFAMPFKKESFDIVFNAGVMEHFNSVKPIQEMMRVTKNNGSVVILVPAKYSLYNLFFSLLNIGLKDVWEEHKFYTKKLMKKELNEAGAKKILVKQPLSLIGTYIVGIIKK